MRKRRVTAAVLVTALSLIGQNCHADVYGLLNKKDDAWSISEITTKARPSGKAVNLATMQPLNYDMETYSCGYSLWNNDRSCDKYASDFRTTRVKWPFTIIANTVLLPFIIPSVGILVDKESYFDDEEFKAAVNKAVDSDGIKNVVALYNDYYTDASRIETEIYQTYSNTQSKHLETVKVQTTVKDLTGLWASNHKLPVLSLTPTVLDHLDKGISGAPEEFRTAVIKAKNSLKDTADQYRSNLSAQSARFNINHSETYKVDGFKIECDCPKEINAENTSKVEAKFTIKSKTFEDVYPSYSNSDDRLSVEFDGTALTCTNKSDKYLQIVSIAGYYNSEVNNFSGVFDLPPQTYKKVYPLKGASNLQKEATYVDVDKAKASRTDFTFGFAVKYRSVDQNIDNTLYKAYKYNLYKVLREARNND